MTQQDIVDAVNRLAVGYNISWADIKTDADKAIYKINAFLGTSYPLMSVILNSPFSHYAIKHAGKYIPIFGDQYIVSIVIPYIASELLSRDEEFTTIYNKYLLDVEDGLYTMFTKEFNRVPHVFRQPDTTGVFFAEGMPQKPLECCNVRPFPKFRINYHMNNNYVLTTDYFIDNTEYEFNQLYTLKPITTAPYYSSNGLQKYTLAGWYTDPACTIEAHDGVVTSDLDFYAKWECENTLSVQEFSINSVRYYTPVLKAGNNNITNLEIPEYINGQHITVLALSLFDNYDNSTNLLKIDRITIPKSIRYINEYTFDNFRGSKIEFPKDSTANITINSNALNLIHSSIAVGTYDQCSLLLPKSIKSITKFAFSSLATELAPTDAVPDTVTREIYVMCETPYLAKPDTFTLPRNGRIVAGNILYRIFYNGD